VHDKEVDIHCGEGVHGCREGACGEEEGIPSAFGEGISKLASKAQFKVQSELENTGCKDDILNTWVIYLSKDPDLVDFEV